MEQQPLRNAFNALLLYFFCAVQCAKILTIFRIWESNSMLWSTLGSFKMVFFIAVDGGWSSWSSWSNCVPKCGKGSQKRMRQCDSPTPKNGGQPCTGLPIQKKPCTNDCPGRMKFRMTGFHISWDRLSILRFETINAKRGNIFSKWIFDFIFKNLTKIFKKFENVREEFFKNFFVKFSQKN